MAHEAKFNTDGQHELLPIDVTKSLEHRPSDAMLQTQAAALQLYLQYNSSEVIAEKLNLPEKTIKGWIHTRTWSKKREALEQGAENLASAQYRNFIRNNRLGTAQRHLETATILELTIQKAVSAEYKAVSERDQDRPITKEHAQTLKTLAEALGQVTAVSARAVSMKELDAKGGDNNDPSAQARKAPLVVLNLGKGALEPRVVDVD